MTAGRLRLIAGAGAALMAAAPAAAQETLTYSYDGRGRLVNTQHTGTANNGDSSCYTYDAADNRIGSGAATGGAACVASGVVAPSFAIGNLSASEGAAVAFTVTRSGSTAGSYTLNYATANGTAAAGSDYTAKSGTLTFGDGIASQTISVATIEDTVSESNETFYVDLSSASGGASIGDSRGIGTINNDDSASAPSFSVSNVSASEGNSLVFTISKAGTTSGSYSINYATANNTAVAGSDYTAKSGTLTFSSSQTSLSVSVATTEDTTVENAETMYLDLSGATGGATISDSRGIGTISDDDTAPAPSFSVSNASAVEGNSLVFTISRAGTTSGSYSVNYATANNTAIAGSDYTAKSGTLTFSSSQTSLSVSVATIDDASVEVPQTMYLNLSGAGGGSTITDSQGFGTISDNDSSGGGGTCCQLQSTDPGTVDQSLDGTTSDEPVDSTTTTTDSTVTTDESQPPPDPAEPPEAG